MPRRLRPRRMETREEAAANAGNFHPAHASICVFAILLLTEVWLSWSWDSVEGKSLEWVLLRSTWFCPRGMPQMLVVLILGSVCARVCLPRGGYGAWKMTTRGNAWSRAARAHEVHCQLFRF